MVDGVGRKSLQGNLVDGQGSWWSRVRFGKSSPEMSAQRTDKVNGRTELCQRQTEIDVLSLSKQQKELKSEIANLTNDLERYQSALVSARKNVGKVGQRIRGGGTRVSSLDRNAANLEQSRRDTIQRLGTAKQKLAKVSQDLESAARLNYVREVFIEGLAFLSGLPQNVLERAIKPGELVWVSSILSSQAKSIDDLKGRLGGNWTERRVNLDGEEYVFHAHENGKNMPCLYHSHTMITKQMIATIEKNELLSNEEKLSELGKIRAKVPERFVKKVPVEEGGNTVLRSQLWVEQYELGLTEELQKGFGPAAFGAFPRILEVTNIAEDLDRKISELKDEIREVTSQQAVPSQD